MFCMFVQVCANSGYWCPTPGWMIFRLRKQFSAPVIRDIYRSCVLPSIEYGSLAWSGMGKKNAQALARIHRRAARLITGTKLADNISSELLLAHAGLTPLAAHRDNGLPSLLTVSCRTLSDRTSVMVWNTGIGLSPAAPCCCADHLPSVFLLQKRKSCPRPLCT